MIATRSVVHVPDVREDESFGCTAAATRSPRSRPGSCTVLFVPLRKDGEVARPFHDAPQEVRPFSDKQIALLQNFAAQAVIAMENARLMTETREALEQQTATAEVLQVINSSPGDLAPVFDAMLEKAHAAMRCEFGALLRFDGEVFHAVAVRGYSAAAVEASAMTGCGQTGSNALERIVRGESIVQVADVVDSDRLSRRPARPQDLVELVGVRTAAMGGAAQGRCAARLISASTARRSGRSPTSRSRCLQNFAAQAVIAMENARLLTETREALEAADRDRRGIAGHQQLARRSRAGVRRDAGQGHATCAARHRRSSAPTTATGFVRRRARRVAAASPNSSQQRALRRARAAACLQVVRGSGYVTVRGRRGDRLSTRRAIR